jgi:hypothetical protein
MMAPLAIVLWLSFDIADFPIMPTSAMKNAKGLAVFDKTTCAAAARWSGAHPTWVLIEHAVAA